MRRAVTAGMLVVLVLGTLLGGALVSGASGTPAARMVRMRGGAPPRPARMRILRPLAGTTRIPLTVTLRPRDPAGLKQYASAVSTPGSGDFRRFLSVAAFRVRFAPSDAQITAVHAALAADGLTPSPVTPNGLVITASGSARRVSRAFSTSFDRVELAKGRRAYINTSAPALPNSIASTVQSVTGLNSLNVVHPAGLGERSAIRAEHPAAERPDVVTGGPQPCPAGRAHPNGYTADDLASAYGFDSLYQQGDLGAGTTIGLLELESYNQSDVAAYESCYGITPSVTNIAVDGFNQTGMGQGEANGDIEDVVGLAPAAKVRVYEAANTDAGYLDDFARMVSDDQANVMSTSWGSCEADTSAGDVAAVATELEEAAIQGQSFFDAAGDSGSADCSDDGPGNSELAVDDPAGQPFMTAVGGTQLSALGPPPTETTWNDTSGAGGGGISQYATMPAYQQDAASSVNVISSYSSGVPCGAPSGTYCREVPDVSGSSSENGGYDFYWDAQWTDASGTSWAAPLWAAFTALVDASPACDGVDIGFVNPLLYQLAGDDYSKYFNDIATGNNDPGDLNGGLYPATPGYDMATGLGTPIGGALDQGLCGAAHSTVTFANPGQQTGTTGTPVNLSLSSTDVNDARITYTVQGLPAGLTLNPETGVISGTPTTPGVSTVTAKATSTDDVSATITFAWDISSNTPPTTTATTSTSTTSTTSPPAPTPPPPTLTPRATILKLKIADHTTATITFTAKDGAAHAYQCALAKLPKPKPHHRAAVPRPDYRACRSPVTYHHLKAAHYEFFARAKGSAGTYSTAATKKFTIG